MGLVALIMLTVISLALTMLLWLLAYAAGWVLNFFWLFVAVVTLLVILFRR